MAPPRSDPDLRPAVAADLSDLARVQLRSALAGFAHIFPESIPKPTQSSLEAEWGEALADEGQSILVAEVDGVVAGVVVVGRRECHRAGADCMLRKLYVDPAFSQRGVGSLLHDRAVAELRTAGCTRIHLWVLERNIVARRMYTDRGWKLQPWARSDWPGSGILELCYTLDLAIPL